MEKNAGIYNVSMVSIKNNRDGLKCLVWWKDRCLEWCFNRVEPERYGDQKYLEQFPKLFQGVHAVENTGAGVAPWNIIQYAIKKNDKVIFVDSSPLIFFHYQALKIYEPKFGLACVPPWSYGDRNVYRSIIYEEYFQKIYEEFRKIQSLAPNFKYGFLPRQNFFAVFKENVYDLLMRLKYLFSITRGSAFQLGSYLCQSQQGRRVYRFKHDTRPDLLINHPLDQHSLVYEVGGYKGNWVAEIYSRYKCTIEVFEPVPFFADEIKKIAKGNKQIHVNKFGLSQKNTKLPIHVAGDGSSIHLKSGYPMIAKLVKVDDYIKKQKVKTIDLMQINIEGGEFDLLDHLISTGLINKVCRLQVQFHDFIPDADNRLKQIRISLAKTHKQQYAYDFVWELWEKKEKKPDVE
jgi:FkbM family methyltransferase